MVGILIVGVTGRVSSIVSVGTLVLVLAFPAESVTVITLLLPSSNHPVDVAIQFTVPLTVAGVGEQVIHGTVTVAPSSTSVRLNVTISQLIAGFGVKLHTVGSVGATSSRSFILIVNASEYIPPFPSSVCTRMVTPVCVS